MENSKKIFNFSKPLWKKLWNSTDYVTRVVGGMTILLFMSNIGNIREGLKNTEMIKLRSKWVENTVKNPRTESLAYLDEESPPTPQPRRTALDQFRAEFAKIRESVEDPYK